MVGLFVAFFLAIASFTSGFFAGTIKGKYLTETIIKKSKHLMSTQSRGEKEKEKEKEEEEDNYTKNISVEEIIQAKEDFDTVLKNERQLQECITNQIRSQRIARVKNTEEKLSEIIDTISRNKRGLEDELQNVNITDKERKSLIEKLKNFEDELKRINQIKEDLASIDNHLNTTNENMGSSLAAKIHLEEE